MAKKKKQIVIPREKAVFWMGENGDWYNEHGKFEHPKIIKHFHSSIKKDENGYYLFQQTDEYEEKVYFPYKETALFVIDVKGNDNILLELNNSDTIKLNPEHLFEKDDKLFLKTGEHTIKFTDRSLLKISKFFQEEQGQLFLKIKNRRYSILQ